jgi:hypothetical protein
MAPKGFHRRLRNQMLARLTIEERAEILSQPKPGESIEEWLKREDEAMLARYTDRRTTRPRPANGHQPDDSDPKKRMESWLTLPTPLKMRLAIACDLLEQYPPTAGELKEYREKYPAWPADFPKIMIKVGDEEFTVPRAEEPDL